MMYGNSRLEYIRNSVIMQRLQQLPNPYFIIIFMKNEIVI